MSAFVRRFTRIPSRETLLEIEAVNIVDLAPPAPSTGVGSGALLLVGEFEDGPFAAGGDAPDYRGVDADLRGPFEVFGSADLLRTFGGFGFVRGTVPHQDPVARRRNGELWNGNGFLKLKGLRAQRLMIARVDNSVGQVTLSPLATLESARGPFALTVGQQLAVEVNGGAPASTTAIAAAPATEAGAAGTFPTLFAGGEQLSIAIDGANPVVVTFAAADQTIGDVITRINTTMGAVVAVNNAGQIDISALVAGTSSSLALANVSGTPLATLGLTAGTYAGTGNVGNLARVTAAELAAIVTGSAIAGLSARATVEGALRLRAAVSLEVAAGAMATALGLEVDEEVTAGAHGGGVIPAGTRVTDGSSTWLTLQTLTAPDGQATASAVKVRRATDDGTGLGAAGGTVTTLTDQPDFADFSVTNPSALNPPLSEGAMDVAYENAFAATLALDKPTAEANFSLSARRTSAVVAAGRQNAIDASAQGAFGRKFITRSALGRSPQQIIADVGPFRSDRVYYCGPGWRVRIPEIALLGAAGGLGFTEDGVITVGSDAGLATICCSLPPEENPAQDTEGLIDQYLAVEDTGTPLDIEVYKAFKRNGIVAPKVDRDTGPTYQSGVTSSLESGRTTIQRRSFADFLQDSIARLGKPYSKRLNRAAERDALVARIDSFLSGLQAVNTPSSSRLEDFAINDRDFNSPEGLALGIFVVGVSVRTYSSLDAIVFQTEIGPNAPISRD